MAKSYDHTYRYTYHGATDVHLPLQGIMATGGDEKTVYETDMPITHPDFHAVKETFERKERSDTK